MLARATPNLFFRSRPQTSGKMGEADPMKTEVLIIGGGLAGSAAAIGLARAGRQVALLERDSQAQHKVCGEFLSREALKYLEELGVGVAGAGGVVIRAVRLANGSTVKEAELPFRAMSLTRRRLDDLLLGRAEEAGATVMRGCQVESLLRHEAATGAGPLAPTASPWRAVVRGAAPVEAQSAFLATGKHDLRGRARPRGKQPGMVAFKMYWRLTPAQTAALEGHVEIMLYRGGYAGLQMVEEGAVNLCCVVEQAELHRLGGRWENLLGAMQKECGLLRQRLEGAQALLARPLAVAPIPYGFVRECCLGTTQGIWALGDQAAVIPSFTGDGMSIALHSARLAARMYLRGETSDHFQQRLSREISEQVALATMVSRGLVWRPARGVFTAAVEFWPGVLGIVARRTRIAEASMLV